MEGCKTPSFFERALGLEKPWRVKEVKMDVTKKVELEVECVAKTVWASEGGERLDIPDWERRSWRHLDTMPFATRINALVPRVKYLGWADADSEGAGS
jgi:hypothetical protein